jgi:hypothetical protein
MLSAASDPAAPRTRSRLMLGNAQPMADGQGMAVSGYKVTCRGAASYFGSTLGSRFILRSNTRRIRALRASFFAFCFSKILRFPFPSFELGAFLRFFSFQRVIPSRSAAPHSIFKLTPTIYTDRFGTRRRECPPLLR